MLGYSATAALAALLLLQPASAQNNDAVSAIVADAANLPSPSVLGPPVGTVSAGAPVDTAAALSSAVQAVTTAPVTGSPTTFVTITSTAVAPVTRPSSFILPAVNPSVTPKVAKRDSGNVLERRDLTYPIDTRNYPVPPGYEPAFFSLQGSTQAAGYLTYRTLKAYDPSVCATFCNSVKTCQFFNIYYEKDPDANNNPIDVIKCSLYSMPQTVKTATNTGQYRGTFHVIITGQVSNGYTTLAAPVSPNGYTMDILNAGINAPTYDKTGQGTFIQPVYLNSYDPQACAAACDAQTVYDKATSSDGCHFAACVYANLYVLSDNGVPKTVVCALYTQYWGSQYAVNTGYYSGNDQYTVSNSIGITNTTAARIYPQTCPKTVPETLGSASLTSTFGETAVGSPTYSSLDKSGNDHLAFYAVPQSVLPATSSCVSHGYVYHVESGLCLTQKQTQSTFPIFHRGQMTLQPCDTSSAAPPQSQNYCVYANYIDNGKSKLAPYFCMAFTGDTSGASFGPQSVYGLALDSTDVAVQYSANTYGSYVTEEYGYCFMLQFPSSFTG
ncbi:hypothetical protein B0A49_06076 [Cryomyces minteri]|uniref:Apple domain-containing protein n=1 Tax=Cryomyces minteri TaxID=331657 RepID=A0A4U0XJH6_9PEZI|nr:hypothetical protein B0A49_06076 [Cryomyces minteri]